MSAKTYQTTRRVEFRDTDAAGIVHFSVFFAYMEQTEHEFLRHLGLSVVSQRDGKTVSWPRVAAECNYRKAIKFEQNIDIELRIERMGAKSVTYGFRFHDGVDPVADGTVTAVCCEVHRGKPPVSMDIPSDFRDQLQPYLSDTASAAS